ncbi:MAG: hypothetical protein AAFW97_00265 [Pseudomonadota bacterium]
MSTGWLVLGATVFLSGCAWLMGMAFDAQARDPQSRFARLMLGKNWEARSVMTSGTPDGRTRMAGEGRMTKILAIALFIGGLLLAFGIIPVDFIDPITL